MEQDHGDEMKSEKYPRKSLNCDLGSSVDERGRNYATLITSPELAAYRVISKILPTPLADDLDVPTLMTLLRDQAAAVREGDLAHAEAMLVNQASSLQSLFVRLTERAMEQDHMPNIEGFMRMALRAQSQCRATLETLAMIKNPPVVYARQANVTTGPQQINNGTVAASPAREKQIEQTQLSGGEHELYPDTRTSSYAGGANQTLEAVGKINRSEVRRR